LRGLINKFSYKVLGLTLAVVLTSQAATVISVLVFAEEENERVAAQELEKATAGFAKAIAHRSDALEDILLSVASNPYVAAAFGDSGNRDMLLTTVQNAMSLANVKTAILYKADGSIDTAFGVDIRDQAAFAGLHQTERTLVVLEDTAFEMAIQPVGDKPVGYLALGYPIDDNIASKMAVNTGIDISLLRTSHTGSVSILGSSLPTEERSMIHDTAQKIASGKAPGDAMAELSRYFSSAAARYFSNDPTVLVLFHKRVLDARRPFMALRGAMTHAAVVSVLGALVLAMLLSRAVTNPVRQLLMAARRISVGNYRKKLDINSRDEFGELAKAFDNMRKGIAEREQRIIYQSEFDSLTGLPNRVHAMDLLRECLRNASKNGDPVTVMVMHLQRFRDIQSSLGHEIGDEVLRQTAQRMSAALDDTNILARLEGDQFLIIAPDTDKDEGKRLARRLAGLLDAGFSVQSVNVTLDPCIGFCVSPEHGRQPDELLRRAAVAKSDAQQGQKRIRIYQNGREARHVRQLAILGDLRRATRENELQLYLQPKVALQNTQVCGAEVLLRWNHPELGQIAPAEFIPLAEQAGCIGIITEWVLGRAVAQARSWKDQGINLPLAVNLSAQDLLGNNLIALLEQELETNRMDASCLILEITEEALVHDIDYAIKILERLRAMGAKTSMDDFGTGYSSLGHLQRLPIDELKIDRAFVTSLPDQTQNAAIVRAIINMAHNLGLEVVAEGVETTAALRWLREEGCERAQGYYLSKPMPAEEFIPWMRHWESLAHQDLETDADMADSLILRPRLIT
jgi:diguanylate cyclase (GGDEF)-like protein